MLFVPLHCELVITCKLHGWIYEGRGSAPHKSRDNFVEAKDQESVSCKLDNTKRTTQDLIAMISSRLQKRLLSVRCSYSTGQSLRRAPQIRLASSSSSSSSASPRPPQPTATRQQLPPQRQNPITSTSAAATRARINAQRETPAAESEAEYKTRYKSASRRWTATMIALPILLVTSYYLFDRCEFSSFLVEVKDLQTNRLCVFEQWHWGMRRRS